MPPHRSPKQFLRQLNGITSSTRRFHPYNSALELRNRSRRALVLPRAPMMMEAGPADGADVDMVETDGIELPAIPLAPQLPQILLDNADQRQRWVLVLLYALDKLYDLNH